jgi:hypothetical protein
MNLKIDDDALTDAGVAFVSAVKYLISHFSFHHHVKIDSEANPVSYPMGTRSLSPGVKAAEV